MTKVDGKLDVEIGREGNDIENIFIRNKDGNTYVGNCWPGQSVWVDFLNENA
jgi:alpha-glucosidase (family GH31 glycosyl hydrolase)